MDMNHDSDDSHGQPAAIWPVDWGFAHIAPPFNDDLRGANDEKKEGKRKKNGKDGDAEDEKRPRTPIKPSYEGYVFTVLNPIRTGEEGNWVRTRRAQMSFSSQELYDKATAHEKNSGLGLFGQFRALGPDQQTLVNRLLTEKNNAEKERHAEWKLFGVRKNYEERRTTFRTWRVNHAIRVTIVRGDKAKDNIASKSFDAYTIHPANIVDLRFPIIKKDQANAEDALGYQEHHAWVNPFENLNGVDPFSPCLETMPSPTAWSQNDQRDNRSSDTPGISGKFGATEGANPAPPFESPGAHIPPPAYFPKDRAYEPDSRIAPQPPPQQFEPLGRPLEGTINIAELVQQEIRRAMRESMAEDKILNHWNTANFPATGSSSSRSMESDDFWSNANSSSDRKYSYSTPGTSPDRGERYHQDQTGIGQRDSPRARPHIHERQRQYQRPSVQRRVTDHPDVRDDAGSRRRDRSVDYERTRIYDPADRHREGRRGGRTRGRDWVDRGVLAEWEMILQEMMVPDIDSIAEALTPHKDDVQLNFLAGKSEVAKMEATTVRATGILSSHTKKTVVMLSRKVTEERLFGKSHEQDKSSLGNTEDLSPLTAHTEKVTRRVAEPIFVLGASRNHMKFMFSVPPRLTKSPLSDLSCFLTRLDIRPAGVRHLYHGLGIRILQVAHSRSFSVYCQIIPTIVQPALDILDYTTTPRIMDSGPDAVSSRKFRLLESTIKALLCSKDLIPILAAIYQEPEISGESFEHNVLCMIKDLGENLRSEARDQIQLDTACAMVSTSMSTSAARSVTTFAKMIPRHSIAPPSSQVDSDTSVSPVTVDTSRKVFDDEDGKAMVTAQHHDMHEFVSNSEAYWAYKANILEFVHKPYERRVLSAVANSLVGPSGEFLDPDATQLLAQEISWVPKHLLRFSYDDHLSYSDAFKAFVETNMGETWNWWPLAPRLHSLRPRYCRLQWKSPCGVHRHIDLPRIAQMAVQQALATAPFLVDIELPSSTRTHLQCNHGSSKASTSGSTPAASQSGSGSTTSTTTSLGLPSQLQQISVPAPVAKQGSHTATQISQAKHVKHHLSLCIVSSSRKFVSLRCDDLKSDVQLFAKMRTSYDKARGWPRLWFSMWQYKYSEFVLFHKYGVRRGARVDVAFPSEHDQMYQFLPRKPHPAPPKGPITPEQFEDHYYNDHCPCWYDWRRYQLSYRGHFNKVNRVALDAVPKRIVRIDMDDGIDEHFYGLYAREERNFLRVVIYFCLFNLPGVVFFFLWLFHWYHGSDLQTASVPLTLSLSLTLGFAAVVFGTRDGN